MTVGSVFLFMNLLDEIVCSVNFVNLFHGPIWFDQPRNEFLSDGYGKPLLVAIIFLIYRSSFLIYVPISDTHNIVNPFVMLCVGVCYLGYVEIPFFFGLSTFRAPYGTQYNYIFWFWLYLSGLSLRQTIWQLHGSCLVLHPSLLVLYFECNPQAIDPNYSIVMYVKTSVNGIGKTKFFARILHQRETNKCPQIVSFFLSFDLS